ncbi:MAG: 16S rRNA (guanine966-N2)-methyltransferase [Candidatus Tokpelaia sp. JSC188]|nr:MAG: 16S rRNA (guanine966-N2)-methyltransferase [Candidatus Tokpelaia sp. JSC188]
MRIVGGKFKGRSLSTPSSPMIRPTSDRIRESLFNILEHRLDGGCGARRILDLFAGTGALGFEALSRGAEAVVFVEKSIEGYDLIQTNIKRLGLTGVARILRLDATQLDFIGSMAPFHLVFADPPYGHGLGEKAFVAALTGKWLHSDAMLILEETRDIEIKLPQSFVMYDERHYGSTIIRLYILS